MNTVKKRIILPMNSVLEAACRLGVLASTALVRDGVFFALFRKGDAARKMAASLQHHGGRGMKPPSPANLDQIPTTGNTS